MQSINSYKESLQTAPYYLYNLAFLFLMLFGLLYSPHVAFWSCIFLLIGAYGHSGEFRKGIFIVAVMMVLFTGASREIGISSYDDLIGTYMPILESQIQYGTYAASGLGTEVGIVAYIRMLMEFFPINDPRTLMFYCVLFTLFFYSLWVFFFYSKEADEEDKGTALAVSLAFIQIGLLTQLLRQEMATPFLLMAIFTWDKRRFFSVCLLLTAFFIHNSSIIIFLFYLLFPMLRLWAKLFIFIGFMLFSLSVVYTPSLTIGILDSLYLSFIAQKVQYYLTATMMTLPEAISNGKFYILIVMIMIGSRIFLKDEIEQMSDLQKKIYDFCFWGSACNLTFAILPNASRVFMIIPGFLLFFVFLPIIKRYPVFFKSFIAIFALATLFVPQRLFGGGTPGFALWDAYNWFSWTPFYYFFGV
ncbi:TPA: EpsG family protein [Citrobacter freundii]